MHDIVPTPPGNDAKPCPTRHDEHDDGRHPREEAPFLHERIPIILDGHNKFNSAVA